MNIKTIFEIPIPRCQRIIKQTMYNSLACYFASIIKPFTALYSGTSQTTAAL